MKVDAVGEKVKLHTTAKWLKYNKFSFTISRITPVEGAPYERE